MTKAEAIQTIAEHIESFDGPATECAETLLDKLMNLGMLPPSYVCEFPSGLKRRLFEWENDDLAEAIKGLERYC